MMKSCENKMSRFFMSKKLKTLNICRVPTLPPDGGSISQVADKEFLASAKAGAFFFDLKGTYGLD